MKANTLDYDYTYQLVLTTSDVSYDIRKLVSITPLDADNYWDATEYEFTFQDGTVVSVYRDDLESTAMLDNWVDTV